MLIGWYAGVKTNLRGSQLDDSSRCLIVPARLPHVAALGHDGCLGKLSYKTNCLSSLRSQRHVSDDILLVRHCDRAHFKLVGM